MTENLDKYVIFKRVRKIYTINIIFDPWKTIRKF